MKPPAHEATRLAMAMLSGPFTREELLRRGRPLIVGNSKWFDREVDRALARFGNVRPRQRELVRLLSSGSAPFNVASSDSDDTEADDDDFEILSSFEATEFVGSALRKGSSVVPWNTVAELADWLGVEHNELDWFADRKQLERLASDEPLRHYRYQWIRKSRGNCRLIEAPKSRLREIQRRLLKSVFENIACHDAAHGFRRGRSTSTHATPHVGKKVVLRMDLQDFFPSIAPSRLIRLLMLVGYPEEVAELLTALCCNHTHSMAWKSWPHPEELKHRRETERLYRRPHFPQGASTSPAIANLCAFRLDCRLTGLAKWAGAAYTRYADDLVFSGDDSFRRKADRFRTYAAVVVMEEGFAVNHYKTRLMHSSTRQIATGLILNEKLNAPRDEFDRLKALLHQCILHGPETQNRSAHSDFRNHLMGRMEYIGHSNPTRLAKLQRLYDAIIWN